MNSLSATRSVLMALTVSAITLAASSNLAAKSAPDGARQASEWKFLANSYAARARVPEMAVSSQRQQVNNTASNKIEAETAGNSIQAENSSGETSKTLRFRTYEDGLFEISMADLSSWFGKSKSAIKKTLKKGKLQLANDGKAVPWYYDKSGDRLLFVGTARESFYASGKYHHFFVSHGHLILRIFYSRTLFFCKVFPLM